MADKLFDDILQRAEKLHSDANMGNPSELPISVAQNTIAAVDGRGGDNSMILDTGLADIFRQSEEMWKRKKLTKGGATTISALSGLKTSKDVSQLSISALPSAFSSPLSKVDTATKSQQGYDESALLGDATTGAYDSASSKEIDRYVESSFERARLEAERSFLNQQILDRGRNTFSPAGTKHFGGDRSSFRSQLQTMGASGENSTSFYQFDEVVTAGACASNQPLEYQQNVFAQKIDAALRKNCQVVIKEALREAVNEINDKEVNDIWEKVFAICSKPMLEDPETVRELRSSKKWAEHVLSKSTKYLQDHFKSHAETVVENNLTIAKRGGVPGTMSLIDAYLNVKQFSYASVEDGGFYGKHPTWMVLFFCLRLGDLQTASLVSKKLFNVAHCSTLVSVVANLVNSATIESDMKIKLGAEWRQGSAACRDSFKKAIYGVFLGFDCPEVNTSIEDWLWARLACCKLHTKDLLGSFKQLQNTICVEFGEEYFVRKGSGTSGSGLYFAALLLTGQLEQAIRVLFTANLLVHAVHVSMLAYQMKLLVLTERVSSEILISDVHDGTMCQLNFARIVLLYVKNFELTNVNFALNYCFFLNKLELDDAVDSKGGRNVFESCVSRLCFLSSETDQILGRLNAHGERLPGLIDKFSSAFNVQDIISYVAADTNSAGDALEACRLFALADRPNSAISLICRQLGLCVSAPSGGDVLQKTMELAHWLTDKYKARGDLDKDKSTLSTLIGLQSFFSLSQEKKYDAAIHVMQKLDFIPLSEENVQSYVANFNMVPEEVRPLLPDVCTTLMKGIITLHDQGAIGSQERTSLKNMAKTIVLYSAMIPYKFPVSTNSELLKLQSRVV